MADLKAQVLDALKAGPIQHDPRDPRMPAIGLLKRNGAPILSSTVDHRGGRMIQHTLIDIALAPAEIVERRAEGLGMALRWHRREPASKWKALLGAMTCPFARDEASDYLRGILQRQRHTDRHR